MMKYNNNITASLYFIVKCHNPCWNNPEKADLGTIAYALCISRMNYCNMLYAMLIGSCFQLQMSNMWLVECKQAALHIAHFT